ncbi:DNA-binding protein [Embleya sp. NBC_00896]|uniref:DNA-binding protein n=1 Tax=Embleya sp. NBC_00896 TaxID=2975961 RepID=UPI00386965E6|nr:DNA-binding protein [Embleya sp. NBC_00896]
MDADALAGHWGWLNHRPRHRGGGLRADAEVVLDAAGRRVLVELCGVGEEVLGRALPSWGREEDEVAGWGTAGMPQGMWRVGGAVVGPVAFGCRLCAARRTGGPVRVVRYAARWERVCVRHGRWGLDADAGGVPEHLDLREVPEVVARRRWAGVARRAARAGVGPGKVFGVAWAVVCRWWESALHWEREEVWPQRLHAVAGGDAGGDFGWWRVVGRDAVVFPEVVAVADALLDPGMVERLWRDSGAGRPRMLRVDGAFCRELGERVRRAWLGSVVVVEDGGPLIAWMGAVVRRRRGGAGAGVGLGWVDDPWRVRQEDRPATAAALLRSPGRERKAGGSGTLWRTMVPAEERMLIDELVGEAEEQLLPLRGAQTGSTADAARHLLGNLSWGVEFLERALWRTAVAALNAGVPVQDVAGWAGLSAAELTDVLTAGRDENDE